MRYFGSKAGTLDDVYGLIADLIPSGTFCDPFGGIAVVGERFKRAGYVVHSGDLLRCAHSFQVAKLVYDDLPEFASLTTDLDWMSRRHIEGYFGSLPPRYGWVYREFALKRQYFTTQNAAAIDSVRLSIDKLARAKLISANEQSYLRACLIESADRVANTAGTYYAYLKDWTRKALKPFSFKLIQPATGGSRCTAELVDAAVLSSRRHYDVLYLDPPYNERDYERYYHFPETLARGSSPRATGKSGVPAIVRTYSRFTRPLFAAQALGELLDGCSYQLLALHYSDDGLIAPGEIQELLKRRGRVQRHEILAPGYSTAGRARRTRHVLYLVQP
jgi:adenine-specific DNA-methyltransferase